MNCINGQYKINSKVYDLRSDIPSGITMYSLSSPIFDGQNYFRKPEKQTISINFTDKDVAGERYVGIRFQIYSPLYKIKSTITINDQIIDIENSIKGKLSDIREIGVFSASKNNTFSISYQCIEKNCIKDVNQYWTQIIRASIPEYKNTSTIGLKTQRWYMNTPRNKIYYGGLSSIAFDGKDYYRNIEKKGFYLKIPQNYYVMNTSFSIYSQADFKIYVMIDNKLIREAAGNKNKGVTVSIPLYSYKGAKRVFVKVECKNSQEFCAKIYNTQFSLSEKEFIPILIPLAICCMIILFLAWLLVQKSDDGKV